VVASTLATAAPQFPFDATTTATGSKETTSLSPAKKSRKKTKIRGPRNFNLKSREVVSDTSDSDSSATVEDDELVARATMASVQTAQKRGDSADSGSSRSSILLAKRRKTATDTAATMIDRPATGTVKRLKRGEDDERKGQPPGRRRSSNSNNLLLSLAGIEKEDEEEEEEEEDGGGSSLVCEETIPDQSSPDQKQTGTPSGGRTPGRRQDRQSPLGVSSNSPLVIKAEEEAGGILTPKRELSSPSTPDTEQVAGPWSC
jgi:hypothetical protein